MSFNPTSAPRHAPRHALVLGATGAFGAHVTAALLAKGWTISALARDPQAARRKTGVNMPIEWIKGDAMVAADVAEAARGAQLIVHAVNPPRYRNWAGTVLPMLEATIAAAKAQGARILLPGTVYNYAPDSGARIEEDAVQAPVTRKGAIRARMEARLREASAEGVRSLVMRAGDFFGPAAENSALAWLVVEARGQPRAVLRPGPADVGHAFAYLPDLARATALVLEREEELADFETFHFGGSWLTPLALRGVVRVAVERTRLPSIPFPWFVVGAMAPFDETMRELLEMRYLWRRPIGLDNGKLVAFLGEEPRTPLVTAIRATLADVEDQETLTCIRTTGGGGFGWTPATSNP
jgi:nucleoside-diphosphate-sugar epimerase